MKRSILDVSILNSYQLRQMQGLAQEVMAVRPDLLSADTSVGELAWVWAKGVDALGSWWRHRIWFEGMRPAGWGWVHLPHSLQRSDGSVLDVVRANLTWQVHPNQPELMSEILGWYDEVAQAFDKSLTVQSTDTQARQIAATSGYVPDGGTGLTEECWGQINARGLDDIPTPRLPDGFRFISAADVSPADAARAHLDAWHPSALTEAAFRRVQRTWPYRADLHVMIRAPDGRLAATAIMWLDEVTRIAEFEPVGTHRDFRRRGLARALQLYGMDLARRAGATRVLVACVGHSKVTPAQGLYLGLGFRELSRDRTYVKLAGASA